MDNCPVVPNPEQADSDNDRRGDICDNCKSVSNFDQVRDFCQYGIDSCNENKHVQLRTTHSKIVEKIKSWQCLTFTRTIGTKAG